MGDSQAHTPAPSSAGGSAAPTGWPAPPRAGGCCENTALTPRPVPRLRAARRAALGMLSTGRLWLQWVGSAALPPPAGDAALAARGWRRRLVRSRSCQSSDGERGAAAALRLAMASGARWPLERRGGIRLEGAPGETGLRGADSREPHTWWAVESQLRLSPRNFLGHLGWRSQRRRLRTGRRGEVPAAGSWGSQDASTYCGAGWWWGGWIGDTASQAYTISLLLHGTRCHRALPRSLPGLPGEGAAKVQWGPSPDSRSLGSPCLSFPEIGSKGYCPGPRRP